MEAILWNFTKVYRNIDAIICCSEFMKKKLNTNQILRDKTYTIYNFIDKVEDAEVVKKDYVLYFGRYSKEKGIYTLLDVCKELPEVKFIFAGTGPLGQEIGGADNIVNLGFKRGKELQQLIQEAKFSVYPSEWYENCPLSVMESQNYGTPVLGADIGGIPELIIDGKTGRLFSSGNQEDLKNKIKEMWDNNELISEYSRNCKKNNFIGRKEYYESWLEIVKTKH